MSNHKIMIVEDEKIVSEDIRASIEKMGYSACAAASSGQEAIEKAGLIHPDLILMDIVLTGSMDGIEAATQIKDLYEIPVVYLTAFGGDDILQRAKVAEPYGYITKPFNERELHIAIEIALYKKQAEARITRMEQWLATVLKSIGDAVVALDKEHRITFMNAVAENLTGWSQEDAIGNKLTEILNMKGQDLGDLEKQLGENVIIKGLTINLIEDRLLIAKDGAEVPISDSVAPIKEEKGEASGSVLIFRDITKRKQIEAEIRRMNDELEQRIRDRTAQLEASNKELEAFSYTISHDLRAPLRSIEGFSQALLEEYRENLDETGKNYLDRVCEAAKRMGTLIDDTLKLSRVARFDFQCAAVDLSRMVRMIAEANQKNYPEGTVEVTVQEGIIVQGDPHLMKIALGNLLDNAWKFTGKAIQPRIEFGKTIKDDETACYVRDNGVGFDMTYVDKLFGPFQRLHTAEEFAGTGIGLATVKRIIARHGGRVWAEGEVGKGATFYFTLPS